MALILASRFYTAKSNPSLHLHVSYLLLEESKIFAINDLKH
jgi:hypothetical protein